MEKLKTKKCKNCGAEFTPFNSMQKACNQTCALELAVKEREKKEAKQKSEEVKRVKQKLKQLSMKDKPKALREAQKAFNAYIRERDRGLPCISCGRSTGCKINAGHYLSVKSHPELRFDEKNVHLQCEHCNCYLSGNQVNYRKGLIERFGESIVDYLESDHELVKRSVDEIWSIRDKYKAKLKELKSV